MLEKPRYNGQVDGYPISDIQSSNGISRSREPATDTRKRVPVRSVQFRDGMAMQVWTGMYWNAGVWCGGVKQVRRGKDR